MSGTSTMIVNCFNVGNISGVNDVASGSGSGSTSCYVGGIIGYTSRGSVTNCYNIGNVSSNKTSVGGIAGYSLTSTAFTNCYWYKGASPTSRIIGSTSGYTTNNVFELNSTDIKLQASFTGFDFSSMWLIDEGVSTPYLSDLPKPNEVIF